MKERILILSRIKSTWSDWYYLKYKNGTCIVSPDLSPDLSLTFSKECDIGAVQNNQALYSLKYPACEA